MSGGWLAAIASVERDGKQLSLALRGMVSSYHKSVRRGGQLLSQEHRE